MKITLTPRGRELLRVARERHPGQSAAKILEQALAQQIAREQASSRSDGRRTAEGFRAWLDEFAALSEKIPPMPAETFSREMIYEDRD